MNEITPEKLDKLFTETSKESKKTNSLSNDKLDVLFNSPSIIGIDNQSSVDINEYSPYMEDVFLNSGLNKERARNQSGTEQGLRTATKLIPNIALGIVENIGYLGELPMVAAGETDFSNALTEWAQQGKKGLKDALPVYRENPNQVFDVSDPAWWYENGSGLVESIAQFYVTGAGVGTLLGKGASATTKLASNILQSGKAIDAIGKGSSIAAQGLTAATLAYTEGAISGNQIYKEVYDNEMQINGGNEELAKRKASEAAATTVKLNTLLITPLNMSGIAPLFTKNSKLNLFNRLGLTRETGESASSYKGRVSQIMNGLDESVKPKFTQRLLLEAGQEGIEEDVNLLAELEGRIEGGLEDADEYGSNRVSRFLSKAFTEEGALNFLLGAIGGAGQTVALNYINPIKDVETGKTSIFNSRANIQVAEEKAYKKNYLQNLINTFEEVESNAEELKRLTKEGKFEEAETAKQRMFDAVNSYHVSNGSSQAFKETFKQIAQTDNTTDLGEQLQPEIDKIDQQLVQLQQSGVTQIDKNYQALLDQKVALENQKKQLSGVTPAMQEGLTDSKEDNDYKQIALSKINEIEQLETEYKKIKDYYGSDYDQSRSGLPQEVLRRYSNLLRTDQNIKKFEKYEADLVSEADRIRQNSGLLNGQLSHLRLLQNRSKSDQNNIEKYTNELSNPKSINIDERQVRFGTKDLRKIKPLLRKRLEEIKSSKSETDKEYQKTLQDYKDINPDFKQSEIDKYLNATKSYDDKIVELNTVTNDLKEKYKEKVAEYDEIRSTKGSKKFIDDWKKDVKNRQEKIEKEQTELINTNKIKVKSTEKYISEKDKYAKDSLTPEEFKRYEELKKEVSPYDNNIDKNIQELVKLSNKIKVPEVTPVQEVAEEVQEEPTESKQTLGDVVRQTEDNPIHEPYTEEPNFIKKSIDTVENDENPNKFLIVEAASAIAYGSFKPYSGEGLNKQTTSNEISPNFPLELLTNRVKAGDKITLEVDTEYRVERGPGVFETYEDLKSREGSETTNMLIPIKIMKGNLKLGYLHDINYINPQQVAPSTTNDEGEYIDNIEAQKAILRELRNKVVENGGKLETTLLSKQGESVLSKQMNGEIIPTSQAVQNENIKLGVITPEGIKVANKVVKTNNKESFLADYNGRTVLLLPYKSKNNLLAVPVSINKIGSNISETLTELVSIYLMKPSQRNDAEKAILQSISDELQLNLNNYRDIQELLSRFIYLTTLSDGMKTDIAKKTEGGAKRYFSINQKGLDIQRNGFSSTSWSKDRRLTDADKEKLKTFLNEMYFNVNQQLFDSQTKIPNISEGKVTYQELSYNNFIKANTSTNVFENKFEIEGENYYSYFDNPVFLIDSTIQPNKPTKKTPVTETDLTGKKTGTQEIPTIKPSFSDRRLRNITVSNSAPRAEDDNSNYASFIREAESDLFIGDFTIAQVKDIVYSTYQEFTDILINRNTKEKLEKAIKSASDDLNKEYLQYLLDHFEDKNRFKVYHDALKKRYEMIDHPFYKGIVDNFDQIFSLVYQRLQYTEVIIGEDYNLDSFEDKDSVFEKVQFNDYATFSIDSYANASSRIKRLLSEVYDLDSNSEIKSNLLGYPQLLETSLVVNKLKSLLADTKPSIQAMMEVLEKNKVNTPWLDDVIYKLDTYEGDKERIQNEFVTVFSNSSFDFKTFLFSVDNNGSWNTKIIDSNRVNKYRVVLDSWQENLLNSNLIKEDADTKQVFLDQEKLDQLIEEYRENIISQKDSIDPIEKIDFLKQWLDKLGIKVSDSTLRYILTSNKLPYNKLSAEQQIINDKGIFGLIYNRLKGKDDSLAEEEFAKKNPLFANSGVIILAKEEAKRNPDYYVNSIKDGKGNNIQAISLKREINRRFDELMSTPEKARLLLQVPFTSNNQENTKYKTWIRRIADEESDFKDTFKLSVIESLKEQWKKKDGKKVKELSERELEGLKIIAYENNQSKKSSVFLYLVPGKETVFSLEIPKERLRIKNLSSNNVELFNESLDILYSIVDSEIQRINKYNSLSNDDKVGLNGFNKFHFFEQLNSLTYQDSSGREIPILLNGEVIINQQSKQAIYNFLQEEFNKLVQDKKDIWRKTNIINENGLDYIKQADSDNITQYTSEYVFNQLLFDFNMYQMFVGDPALFNKSGHEATWDNIFKRKTKDLAPALSVPQDQDNLEYIQISLSDIEVSSEIIKNIAKDTPEFVKLYQSIVSTDAQEYVTGEEYLFLLKQYGKISTDDYNLLKPLVKSGKDLTKEQLTLFKPGLFQVQKPVAVGKRIKTAKDGSFISEKIEYVKSSAFPLLPQWTKGTSLDVLRKEMEKIQKTEGKNVRASFRSGNKLGGGSDIKLVDYQYYDGKDNILEDNEQTQNLFKEGKAFRRAVAREKINISSKNYVTLNRDSFGIQQEVPFDEDKKYITDGSQQRKLILSLINEIENSSEIVSKYNNLYDQLYNSKLNTYLNDILNEEKSLDISKLQIVLNDEATKRGWTRNQIKSLELEQIDNGILRFKAPIWANSASQRIESLLASLMNNKVLKLKRFGNSYALASDYGFDGISNDIVYTSKYTGKLLGTRIENGKIQPAQILVPSKFRNNKGELVDISKFTTEVDGKTVLDMEKIPQELLVGFSYRIPTQFYNSMSHVEIVGFLPAYMGDLVIAPVDFIAQMGSDFDIDKLYMYLPSYVFKDGKFSKINQEDVETSEKYLDQIDQELTNLRKRVYANRYKKDSISRIIDQRKITQLENVRDILRKSNKEALLQNEILDIELDIISNPKMMKYIKEPLTSGKLLELSKSKRKKFNLTRLYDGYSNSKYVQSQSAGIGIGVFATLGTFLSVSNGKDLSFLDQDGNRINLGFDDKKGNAISDIYSLTGKPKITISSYFLSASLDDEKEPINGALNINSETFSVIEAMILSGFEEEDITNFLTQPVIYEYLQEYSYLKSKTDEFIEDIPQRAFSNVLSKRETEEVSEAKLSDIGDNNPDIEIAQLNKFLEFKEYGDRIRAVKAAINTDSKYIPGLFLESTDKENSINNLYGDKFIANSHTLLGEYSEDGVFEKAEGISGIASKMLIKNNEVFSELMPYSRPFIQKVFKRIEQLKGVERLSASNRTEIFLSFKDYLYSDAVKAISNENLFDLRQRLLYGEDNLSKRVNEAQLLYPNNSFLQVLSPKTPTNTEEPIVVEFNNAAISGIDEDYLYRDFIDLLSNETTKELAEDLIRYSLITSASEGARTFNKFIPTSYFEYYNIYDQLYNHQYSTMNSVEKVNDFIDQFIRNKPKYVKKVDIDTIQPTETFDKLITQFNYDSADNIVVIDGQEQYSPYLSYYYKDGKKQMIYQHVGNGSYHIVNNLGFGLLSEYDFNSSMLVSAMEVNNITDKVKAKVQGNKQTNREKTVQTPITVNSQIVEFNFESVDSMLESAYNSASNESYKTIVQLVRDGLKGNDVKVVSDINLPNPGSYMNNPTNTISINPSYSKKIVQSTILEESIHALTANSIANPKTASQKELVDNLDGLRRKIRSVFESEPEFKAYLEQENLLLEYRTASKERRSEIAKNMKALSKREIMYYRTMNVEEFVVGIFENAEFQQILNDTPFGKKNALQRLLDVLVEFIKSFKLLDGSSVKNESLLEEAIKSTISLFQEQNLVEDSFNDINRIEKQYPENIIVEDYSFKSSKLLEIKENLNENNNDKTISDQRDFNYDDLIEYGMSDKAYNYAKNNQEILNDLLNLKNINNKYSKSTISNIIDIILEENVKLIDKNQLKLFSPNTLLEKPNITQLEIKLGVRHKDGTIKRRLEKDYLKTLDDTAQLNKKLIGTGYQAKITKVAGEKGDRRTYDSIQLNYIGEVSLAPKTEDEKIINFIDKLQSEIDKLDERINTEKDYSLIQERDDKKKKLDYLLESQTFSSIIDVGQQEIQRVKNVLSKDEITSFDLIDTFRNLHLWLNAPTTLFEDDQRIDENSAIVKSIKELSYQSSDLLKDVWYPKNKAWIKEKAKSIGLNHTMEDLYSPEKDVSLLKGLLLDLSTADSNLLNILNQHLVRTHVAADDYIGKEYEKINKKFEEFKKSSFFKQNGFEPFYQKTASGNKTGNFINRVSDQYFVELFKLKNKVDDLVEANSSEALIKEARNEYHNWLDENNVRLDVRKLYKEDDSTGKLIYNEDKQYINELKSQIGEERTNDLLELSKIKIDRYNLALENISEHINNTEDELSTNVRLEIWKTQNSPIEYLNYKNDPDTKIIVGNKIYRNGYKFIASTPIEKWHDKNFDLINSNQEAKDFYRFYSDSLNRLYAIAPKSIKDDLQYNYLPVYPMSLMEEISQKGLLNAGTGISDRMLELFTEKEKGSIKEVDKITDREELKLLFPIRPRDYRFQEEKEIDNKYRTYDLEKILKTSTNIVYTYAYKHEIEDVIRLINIQFDEQKEIVNRKGKVQGEEFEEVIAGGLRNKKSMLKYTINKGFFGYSDEKGAKGEKKYLTSKDKELKALYEKMIEDEEEKRAVIEKLGSELSSTQTGNTLLAYVQLKSMGWNMFSGISNMLFGSLGNYIYSAGNQEFGEKDLSVAMSKMLHSFGNVAPGLVGGGVVGTILLPGFGTIVGAGIGTLFSANKSVTKEGKKINNLMKRFNVLGDILDGNIVSGVSDGTKKWYDKFSPYALQKKSEYFVHGLTLVSMMNNKKVKVNTEEGEKEISLYEAFDEEGNWKYGEAPEWTDISSVEKANEFFKFKNSLDKVVRTIHGNYDQKKYPIQIKGNLLGRAAMQFRSWVPEGFTSRFGEEYFDPNLNRKVKGRYLVYQKDTIKNIQRVLMKAFLLKKVGKEISEEDRASLYRNAAELQILISVMALAMFLRYMSDDEDDEYKYLSNFALNQLFRLQDDIMFYTSPLAMENITRNIVPAFGIFGDSYKVFDYATDVLAGDTSDRKLESLQNNVQKLFPGGSTLRNVEAAGEQLFKK
jgi:hypothetical protein